MVAEGQQNEERCEIFAVELKVMGGGEERKEEAEC